MIYTVQSFSKNLPVFRIIFTFKLYRNIIFLYAKYFCTVWFVGCSVGGYSLVSIIKTVFIDTIVNVKNQQLPGGVCEPCKKDFSY